MNHLKVTLETDHKAATAQPCFDASVARQTPFFGQTLMLVSRTWRNVLEAQLAQIGLTDATWVPLFHLHEADHPMTLKQLAQCVGLDSSSLVRVVDLLESRGLLLRETDTHDRRCKSLHLTTQGLHMVANVRAKLYQVESQLLAGMDASTVQALRTGMQQLHVRLVSMQVQDKACA